MRRIIYLCVSALLLAGCTKEVQIDIPGYQEQLVIDGRIETGQPPIVLISRSKEVYASTDLDAFLSGYVSGAIVTVSNGTQLFNWIPSVLTIYHQAQKKLPLRCLVSRLINWQITTFVRIPLWTVRFGVKLEKPTRLP